MKETKISIIPLDTYSFISNKQVSHDSCPVCGKENFDGAEIVYGAQKMRFAICNSCLYRLDKSVLPKAKDIDLSYTNRNITLRKSLDKQKCHCDSEHTLEIGYTLILNDIRVKCCPDCLQYLHDEIHKYNMVYNQLYLDQEKYAQQRETNILLTQQEIYESKLIKEAKMVAARLGSPYLIEYYYSLNDAEKVEFLEQYRTSHKYAGVRALVHKSKIHEEDFIDSLVLTKAFPHISCSLQHTDENEGEHKAHYYLKSTDLRLKSFRMTVCQTTLKTMLSCLKEILDDVLTKTVSKDGIEITRETGDDLHKCYSCDGLDKLLVFNWGNACFVLCENCAEKFYEKVNELLANIDSSYVPKSIDKIAYRDYNERKMQCYKNINSVNIIGYPIKRAKRNKAEFCIHTKIYPDVHCELFEHNYLVSAKTVITTQRTDDDFCLVLCPTCATHLETALQHANYDVFNTSGTSIFIQKRRWLDNEHCIFCGASEGDCNRIRLGSAEFNCCNNCKDKLKNTVAKCKKPILVKE